MVFDYFEELFVSVAEQLRNVIAQSGETHYRIGKSAGIAPSILDRFVSRETDYLGGRNVDRLCEYFGLELSEKKIESAVKQTGKKTATKRKRAKKRAE